MVGKFGLCKDMCQTSWQPIFYYSNVMEFMSVWGGNKWFRVWTLKRGLATNGKVCTREAVWQQMERYIHFVGKGGINL